MIATKKSILCHMGKITVILEKCRMPLGLEFNFVQLFHLMFSWQININRPRSHLRIINQLFANISLVSSRAFNFLCNCFSLEDPLILYEPNQLKQLLFFLKVSAVKNYLLYIIDTSSGPCS